MNYSMKNSQQSLMNLFHLQNNSQYMQGNNQNLKYLLKNFKINNIISHNNCYISKFKTTKNSPERLIFEKTSNVQKNIDNNINHKKENKYPIRGKILLGNQKKPDKIVEELLRNKINKNKQKINNKVNENKNNSMNKGTIYRNINANANHNHNHTNVINDNLNINLNNISHIIPNKNNVSNKNILGFDFTNQISGPTLAGPNSYRAPQKKDNNMLEDEEYFIYINKNNKNINKNINKKNNISDKKLFYQQRFRHDQQHQK